MTARAAVAATDIGDRLRTSVRYTDKPGAVIEAALVIAIPCTKRSIAEVNVSSF